MCHAHRTQLARLGLVALLSAISATWAAAQNAPKLRYGFQGNRQYAYDVKIEAELEDEINTRQGTLTYHVLSATEQQAVVKCSGVLVSHSKMKPGQRGFPIGPPRIGPPPFAGFPRFGPTGPEGITINRQGEILVSKPLTHLPYLLGDQETLLIEELPADGRPNWSKQRDVSVRERTSHSMFPMMFGPRAESTTQRPAKEQVDYAVLETRGDAIRVSKKYSLRTADEGGTIRFDMSGAGEFEFDATEGVIKSLSMKFQIRINEPNLQKTVPVSVVCRLLTPAELAERQKKAEEARLAAEKAAAPKPLEAGERAKLLADLRSRDEGRMRAAADRLAKATVDDKPADFARALTPLLKHQNDWVKGAAAKALIVWVTPEAEEALVEATASENLWVRAAAIEAVAKLQTERAAEAIAAQMYRNRGECAKALKAMGPVAEAATIPCLNDRDHWVRQETCAVLEEIGGAESLGALRQFAQKATSFELRAAQKAIGAIEARLAQGPRPAAGRKSTRVAARPATPTLRTWRDASGQFEIEATLVVAQGGKVTLKRKDGRELTVPAEKLSKEDQAFIEKQSQAAGVPENPFE